MIVSKTPLRVSFFGGGTDIPDVYKKTGGAVISTAIDKYVYVILKKQSELFKEKYRLNYFKTEIKDKLEKIDNEIIRESLKLYNVKEKIYIATIADIPSGSGLGSSSSFCVGLLRGLSYLKSYNRNNYEIAVDACKVEIDKIRKPIGIQDQFATSLGNLNVHYYKKSYSPVIKRLKISNKFKEDFENKNILIWTGKTRNANRTLSDQKNSIKDRVEKYELLNDLTKEAISCFEKKRFNQLDFVKYLNESWLIKKSFAKSISNNKIDEMIEVIKSDERCGVKLCGAGNGGFLLFSYPNQSQRNKILKKLNNPFFFPLKISNTGTSTLLNKD